ncbi:hypothetical protein QFC19_001937 [Naganishia cerealis]|uniref:Uncharacterized protein n=1 Tax=Naganishia cerealis TaxID=610337 RepID=A0ACC2WF61_9TREE|nr:hypothetical protein QFC19_001937 [Naganishia cerealis]
MVNAQSSAAGLISLLQDTDPEIQSYAIEELDRVAGLYWAEISDHVVEIKIYFYLGAINDAVNAALNAGEAFTRDQSEGMGEYKETIIANCLDRCITDRSASTVTDSRLTSIVLQVLDAGAAEPSKLRAGLALSLRDFDALEEAVRDARKKGNGDELLRYILAETTGGASGNEGMDVGFMTSLMRKLLELFEQSSSLDYTSIAQIWLRLNEPSLAATTLSKLIAGGGKENDNLLEAYQIGFDLADTASQEFLGKVIEALPVEEDAKAEDPSPLQALKEILSGEKSIRLYLEFLSKNNHSDLLLLKNIKDALEARASIFHSAVTFANAFAHSGTTSDQFLRDNLEWLGRASNWSMFSATAALGVIHKGSLAKGMAVLGPYLPPDHGESAPHSSPYSEGGSLYALGLIHAGHGNDVKEYLKGKLRASTDETRQHGAALGLGVACMATRDEDLYEALRDTLFQDSSVAGEASGYAMGLVMLGSGSQVALDEMIQYAHETQHEKIIRGLAIGIAFLMYGRAEQADSVIDQLLADKDAILRYGGMYTIGLAYAGTANNQAIRKLLQVAVSDANDDVRRAAVTCLGFVLFRNHTQVPRVVQLLSQSYNPHVRQGATLALGISCAGTGLSEAIDLLEPMMKDPIDFVRQGAFIALSMICIQHTKTQTPKVESIRKALQTVVSDKHEDSLAKFGAAISQGIIDAGGRNVTISMQSKAGTPHMNAIVGMTLFTQFWYWFPLAHCLSLSFQPTAIIGLDASLKMPQFEFVSHAKPSVFAYPAPYTPPVKETVEKIKTAVLSTTARANARAKTKEKEKGGEAMETDDKHGDADKSKTDGEKKDSTDEKDSQGQQQQSATKKAELSSETLSNLVRVTPAQLRHIEFPTSGRYQPVRQIGVKSPSALEASRAARSSATQQHVQGGGIIMMRDTRPDEPAEYIELTAKLDRTPPPPPPAIAITTDNGAQESTAAAGGNRAEGAMEVDASHEAEEASVPPSFESDDLVQVLTNSVQDVAIATSSSTDKAHLLLAKSHVFVHPSAKSKDQISGYLGIAEVAKGAGKSPVEGKKGVVVFWIPASLAELLDEEGKYEAVSERSFAKAEPESAAESGEAEEDDYVFVTLPSPTGPANLPSSATASLFSASSSASTAAVAETEAPDELELAFTEPDAARQAKVDRERQYAWSVPVEELYSILVYPPSMSSWYGSITIKLFLINPSKPDREVHEIDLGDERENERVVPKAMDKTRDAAQHAATTGGVPYPPRAKFPANPSAVVANGIAASAPGSTSFSNDLPQAFSLHPARTQLLSSFSQLTQKAKQITQQVLSQPFAEPIVPHLPQNMRKMVDPSREWESRARRRALFGEDRSDTAGGGAASVTGEFESARVYLARWARVVAEEGERSRKRELASTASLSAARGGHDATATTTDARSDLGIFEMVRSARGDASAPPPSTTRTPGNPVTRAQVIEWHGKGLDESYLRGEVFRHGLSETDDTRKLVWEVLLGVIPWQVGLGKPWSEAETERAVLRRDKKQKYDELKSQWQNDSSVHITREGDDQEAASGSGTQNTAFTDKQREEWHRIDVSACLLH